MKQGKRNRMEGGGRCRRLSQIEIGCYNSFTQGCWLWPEDTPYEGVRIRIGNRNYFNRNLMIDACGFVEIGDENMFGPDVFITDSDHTFVQGISPHRLPMKKGTVKIGNGCWIGAKVVILKDVNLGDGCVIGAGAVVSTSVAPGAVVACVPGRVVKMAPAVADGTAREGNKTVCSAGDTPASTVVADGTAPGESKAVTQNAQGSP